MKKYGFIYITTNLINNKKYIGQKKYIRGWESYLGSGIALNRAIKKYGRENFSLEIIDEAYTKEELNQKEKEYIEIYNSVFDKNWYNIASGGEGGHTTSGYTVEQKREIAKKISEAKKGKIVSEEVKERIGEKLKGREPWNKGQKMDEKYRETVSKFHADVTGENNPMFGVKLTGEKNGMFGKTHSVEARSKISKKNKTFWENLSEEERQKRLKNLHEKSKGNFKCRCKKCGKDFIGRGSNHRICDDCAEDKRPKKWKRICRVCETEFMSAYHNSIKCENCKGRRK